MEGIKKITSICTISSDVHACTGAKPDRTRKGGF